MSTANPALEHATAIVTKLQQAGYVAYFAGGCVRDRLMGRTPSDYDVATSAHPQQVAALFPNSQHVGAAFGVMIVRGRKTMVEVATFRTDGQYTDGRHPENVTFATAQVDAQRRDFTCNGLFFDPVANQLHDFVHGQQDIAARTLRAIGEPAHRFAEDHLRMLRAVRFAAKLEFQIEGKTLQAIQTLADRITTVSRERIGEEMRMILEHPQRVQGAALLAITLLLQFIWPAEFRGIKSPSVWLVLEALPEQVTTALGLAAMQLDLSHIAPGLPGKTPTPPNIPWPSCAAALRTALMLSNQETDDLIWQGKKHHALQRWPELSKAQMKRLIADPRWAQLATLHRATIRTPQPDFDRRIEELIREGVAPEPFITGNDLIALGAQPGKEFKQWIEQLYDMQLEGRLQNKQDAIAHGRQLLQKRSEGS